jgi:hypothetical protein
MSAKIKEMIEDRQNKEIKILELIQNGHINRKTYMPFSDGKFYILNEDEDEGGDNNYILLYKENDYNDLYYLLYTHSTGTRNTPNKLKEREPHVFDDEYDILLNKLYANETNEETNKGGKRTVAPAAPVTPAYKLNGEKVHLLINKKKLHRSVYVKGNGKAKYCKINNEFVLLSKLKNKII